MTRPKTCQGCGDKYQPEAYHPSFQRWCGIDCGIKVARAKQDKAREKVRARVVATEKKRHKARKEALKGIPEWTKEAQVAVNGYIRARDAGRPCISCGCLEQKRFTGGHFDCGHFRPRSVAGHLRFNLLNMAGQCKRCNRDLSGNTLEMRKGMIERFGIDRVERIENDNSIRKFDIEYLRRIKTIFSKRARHYKRIRGAE